MKQFSITTLYILIVLAAKPCHGYEIMQQVRQETDGDIRLGPGTLYGAIKRLLEDGLIEPVDEAWQEADERRRYYRLTMAGREVLLSETEKSERMAKQARTALGAFGI